MNQVGFETLPPVSTTGTTSNSSAGWEGTADFEKLSWEETDIKRVAGYIKRIDLKNFPTGTQTIRLSPNREKVAVLRGRDKNKSIVLCLAIEAALGVPLWRLRSKWERRVEGLENVEGAMIRVTFWNEGNMGKGPDAFEPLLYGRQIIVERHICSFAASAEGSVLRIANERGRVVSRNEGTLCRMLQHFRISLDHPLLRVEQRCMEWVLDSQQETLHWMFLQAHQLDAEGWEELTQHCQGQVGVPSLQKVRESKEERAGKLREEAKELQQELEDWESSTAELKLCFQLARYRQHREELTTKQELLSQTQRQCEDAKTQIPSMKELQSLEEERTEKVAASLGSHDSLLKELRQRLKSTWLERDLVQEELKQVQKDKGILAKETSRLELASRMASRRGIIDRHQKGEKYPEPGSEAAASMCMALKFPEAVLVADHRKVCKQASKHRRKERALFKKMGALRATMIDCEADMDKYGLLAAGCREELAHTTATVNKIKLQLETKQDELKGITQKSADLKSAIASLEAMCKDALLAARQFVPMDGTKAISQENAKTNDGVDDDSEIDRELMMLLQHGVALSEPALYETKLQEKGTRKKAETAEAYCSILREVDQISEEIRQAQNEEIELDRQRQCRREHQVKRCSRTTLGWYQHFLAVLGGSGTLEFDHDMGKVYMSCSVPSNEMFWAQSFLFALLGSSGLSLCVFNCEQTVAEVYRPFFRGSLIRNALQLDCQSLVITSQDCYRKVQVESDSDVHVVNLPD